MNRKKQPTDPAELSPPPVGCIFVSELCVVLFPNPSEYIR